MPLDLQIRKSDVATLEDTNRHNPLKDQYVIPNHPSRTVFISPSRGGKSNCMMELLTQPAYLLGYFSQIFVISPSVHIDPIWQKLQSAYDETEYTLVDEPSQEAVEQIIGYMAQNVQNRHLLIFDDCISEAKIQQPMLKAMVRGRHLNCSVWLATQSYMKLHRQSRDQASNLFIFAGVSPREMDRFAEEQYLSVPGLSQEKLKTMLLDATAKKYSFMHINKQTPNSRQVFRKNLNQIYRI